MAGRIKALQERGRVSPKFESLTSAEKIARARELVEKRAFLNVARTRVEQYVKEGSEILDQVEKEDARRRLDQFASDLMRRVVVKT